MGEIGGYLGLETFEGRMYHEELIAVNSARNALVYILRARRVRKLYIPVFLCDAVKRVCRREGVCCEEYHVDEAFLPVFDRTPGEDEFLYVVNYYGQLTDAQLTGMQSRWKRIIVDHVQAYFRKPLPGLDAVYSCRKFYGVPDGGFAATDARLEESLTGDRSAGRMRHLLGRLEEGGAAHYQEFLQHDEGFDDLPLRSMSPLTRNLLRAADDERIRCRREENYACLSRLLGVRNPLRLTAPVGPYAYPFYCPEGMAVRRLLAARRIYVPTLWPNVPANPLATPLERNMAENILPLPCDQRYGAREMTELADALLDAVRNARG